MRRNAWTIRDVIDMVGEYSLYAFGIAIIVTWVGSALAHLDRAPTLFTGRNVHMPGPLTAEFDHDRLDDHQQTARVGSYDWAVVSRLTRSSRTCC